MTSLSMRKAFLFFGGHAQALCLLPDRNATNDKNDDTKPNYSVF